LADGSSLESPELASLALDLAALWRGKAVDQTRLCVFAGLLIVVIAMMMPALWVLSRAVSNRWLGRSLPLQYRRDRLIGAVRARFRVALGIALITPTAFAMTKITDIPEEIMAREYLVFLVVIATVAAGATLVHLVHSVIRSASDVELVFGPRNAVASLPGLLVAGVTSFLMVNAVCVAGLMFTPSSATCEAAERIQTGTAYARLEGLTAAGDRELWSYLEEEAHENVQPFSREARQEIATTFLRWSLNLSGTLCLVILPIILGQWLLGRPVEAWVRRRISAGKQTAHP
jgi:hypothetical protein